MKHSIENLVRVIQGQRIMVITHPLLMKSILAGNLYFAPCLIGNDIFHSKKTSK